VKSARISTFAVVLAATAGVGATLSQITPVVELVGIFHPAIPDVSAVVHIGNQNIFNAGVNLGLRLLHGGAEADDDQDNA
jgi:hypothetical protein